MSRLRDIFLTARGIDDPAVDASLAAALPTADASSRRLLVKLLIDRGHPDGTTGLVEHYHLLEPELQQIVIDHTPELFRALRHAAGRGHEQGAANTVEIIARAKAVRLSYLISEQLMHGPQPVRDEAARCLLALARHCTNPNASPEQQVDAVTARYLQSAVVESVERYDRHERPLVLRAAFTLFPRPMPKLTSHWMDHRSQSVEPVRQMLTQAQHAETRHSLLLMLLQPTLATQAMQGVRNAARRGEQRDLLVDGHMLLLPRLRAVLSKVQDPEPMVPDKEQIQQMLWTASRALAWWITALPLERPSTLEHLGRMRRCDDALSRLTALRQLMALAGHDHRHPANDAIARYTRDAHAGVARVALRHLIRLEWPDLPRLLPDLVNAEHPGVRDLAAGRLASMGLKRLWDAWPRLDPRQRLAAGRALIKLDPGFPAHLADRLRRPDRDQRLRALAIIHTLNQGTLFEKALHALANDPDEKIASAAVIALGSAGSDQTIHTLEDKLDHPDSRVRANAVEALQEARCTQHVDKLMAMAEDDDNRPRANAIAAMMEMSTADALTALQKMLADPREQHRTSALWLAEHAGVIEVARYVADLAVGDPDTQVRDRALRVMEVLINSLSPHNLQGPGGAADAPDNAPDNASDGPAGNPEKTQSTPQIADKSKRESPAPRHAAAT